MQYVIEEDPPNCLRAVLATVLFTACFGDFLLIETSTNSGAPEPKNYDQSFSLRAKEIGVRKAEQLFQYLQQELQERCLYVCNVWKNAALIEMLDCCSMPPFEKTF